MNWLTPIFNEFNSFVQSSLDNIQIHNPLGFFYVIVNTLLSFLASFHLV